MILMDNDGVMTTIARKMKTAMKKINNDVDMSNDDIQGMLMTRMMHL